MKEVDTRVEGAHYFAKVFLTDTETFETRIIVVRDHQTPEEVLREEYAGKNIEIDRTYPINLLEFISALKDYDERLRKDHTPKGIAQIAGLEGEVKFEGIE